MLPYLQIEVPKIFLLPTINVTMKNPLYLYYPLIILSQLKFLRYVSTIRIILTL